MSYAGRLYYVEGNEQTVTIGMVTLSVALLSQDLLAYLPNGNLLSKIAHLFDPSEGGIALPTDGFIDTAKNFPSMLHDGLVLPTLAIFLTGTEATVELSADCNLQYVTGDTLYRGAEQTDITVSTVTVCRIATAVYRYVSSEITVYAPIYPSGYRLFSIDGGDVYLPRNVNAASYVHFTATQWNPFPDSSLGFSEGLLEYLSTWYNGLPVGESHILAAFRERHVEARPANNGIEYWLVSQGLGGDKGIIEGHVPDIIEPPYIENNQSSSQGYLLTVSGYIPCRRSEYFPPYYIPMGGGGTEGDFRPIGERGYGHLLVAPVVALALIWILKGGKK